MTDEPDMTVGIQLVTPETARRNDRADLVAEIEHLTREIKILGFSLSTVYQREGLTRDNIAASHGGPGKFDPSKAEQRAPWFENLTEIAEKYGPDKQRLMDMKRRVKAYTKEVEAIDKVLAKEADRALAKATKDALRTGRG